ncbi:MAG: hypothetical protein FJW96_13070 [Actinobacteria bacterium]|nr:hypothetical protein [Actinomycetota bacterium]
MLLRIVLVGALLIAAMVYVKQDRVLSKIGLVGTCVPSLPAANADRAQRRAQWWSCGEGAITGYPGLEAQSCKSAGRVGNRELWYCATPISEPV